MKISRILVIPGIGDLHWVALKLRAFVRNRHIEDAEIWIWDFDQRPRSMEYVDRLEFCRRGEYWKEPLTNRWLKVFNECYHFGTRDVIEPFGEFDHFLCFNGSMRQGRKLQRILPECEIEWEYQLRTTPRELSYSGEQLSWGRYLLFYFSDQGMFLRHWLNRWSTVDISQFVDAVHRLLPDYRLILTGAGWDRAFADHLIPEIKAPIENMVGETNFDQLMGLIRNASGFAGWCGGNTIVSTHLGKPTFMLWSDYFKPEMQTTWVKPEMIGKSYLNNCVVSVKPEVAAARFCNQVRGHTNHG